MRVSPQRLLRWLAWMLAATVTGSVVQLALNFEVYQAVVGIYAAAPHWLYWAAGGIAVAAAHAAVSAHALRALRPALSWRSAGLVMLAALCLDPYYLGHLGLQAAAAHSDLVRTAGLLIIAWAVAGQRPRDPLIMSAALIAAGLVAILVPRYFLVPPLMLKLEQASQAPMHLLVFLRDQILWLAATLVVLLPVHRRLAV